MMGLLISNSSFIQLDNTPTKDEVEFDDYEIFVGYTNTGENGDYLLIQMGGNEIQSVHYHLDMRKNPCVFVSLQLRDIEYVLY